MSDWNGHIPERGTPDTSAEATPAAVPCACSCACGPAQLELERLRGFIDALSIIAGRNLERLDDLLGQAREQHATEG